MNFISKSYMTKATTKIYIRILKKASCSESEIMVILAFIHYI